MAGKKRKRAAGGEVPRASNSSNSPEKQKKNAGISLNGHEQSSPEVGDGSHIRKKLKRGSKKRKKEVIRKREGTRKLETFSEIRTHRCGFVTWTPGGVTCLALNSRRPYIAIAREGSTVELCSIAYDYAVMSNVSVDSRVTSLTFSPDGKILLVSTLSGKLILYNCHNYGLDYRCTVVPGGGAIWDAKLDPLSDHSSIILACEDSRVRILQPEETLAQSRESETLPNKPFEFTTTTGSSGRARALSVAISDTPDGPIAVCDARGYIRFLNRSSGQTIHSCLISERCPIWTCAFVQKGTQLITGDARGIITIWDSATGTIRESLALENTEGDARALVSTGVCANGLEFVGIGFSNGSIAFLVCSSSSNGSSGRAALWRPLRGTVFFDGDVSCCAVQRYKREERAVENKRFIFGSQDTRVIAFPVDSIGSRRPYYRILPCAGGLGTQLPVQVFQPSSSHFRSGLIVARQRNHVDFWIANTKWNSAPQLLLRLKLSGLGSDVSSCAMNSDGSQIAVAGASSIRVLAVDYLPLDPLGKRKGKEPLVEQNLFGVTSVPKIRPLKTISKDGADSAKVEIGPLKTLRFVGHDILAAISADGLTLCLIKTSSDETPAIFSGSSFMPHAERFMVLASSNNHLAIADIKRRLYIASSAGAQERMVSTNKMVTSMAFADDGRKLIAVSADFRVHILSLEDRGNWSYQMLNGSLRLRSPAMGLSVMRNFLLIHGHNFAEIVPYSKSNAEFLPKIGDSNITRRIEDVRGVLGAGVIDGEIFIAHQPWEVAAQQLSTVISKKKFGG